MMYQSPQKYKNTNYGHKISIICRGHYQNYCSSIFCHSTCRILIHIAHTFHGFQGSYMKV